MPDFPLRIVLAWTCRKKKHKSSFPGNIFYLKRKKKVFYAFTIISYIFWSAEDLFFKIITRLKQEQYIKIQNMEKQMFSI